MKTHGSADVMVCTSLYNGEGCQCQTRKTGQGKPDRVMMEKHRDIKTTAASVAELR